MKNSAKAVVVLLVITIIGCSTRSIQEIELKEEKELIYLLHGLGRNKVSMWKLASRLEKEGFVVKRIGYSSFDSTPGEILKTVSDQINKETALKFRKVHFAGHSLGGLLIRAYLQDNKIQNLGNVVLIGTPNHGTTIVDRLKDKWYLKMLGPMTLALGTGKKSFPSSLKRPYYTVGVIAGISEGVFSNESMLPGKDDGIVPLKSTKLNGMKDMVVIRTNHTMMRYNKAVASQTAYFLRKGVFEN